MLRLALATLFSVALVAPAAEAPPPRPPAVAGHFYPADVPELTRRIDGMFARAKAPEAQGRVVALLVPHAGIEYSGETAALAYNMVAPGSFDTIVILGSGHYVGVEGAALYPGSYATPLGRVEYDAALGAALMKASPLIIAHPQAHEREHSIEVQVPFLLRRFKGAKLVALTMNTQELAPAVAVGEAVAKAVKGRRVLIAASSDLSHYPEGTIADKVDSASLAALAGMDPAFFWTANRFLMNRRLPRLECAYCGEPAVTATLTAARALGADRFQLLRRLNSGDVLGERDYRHVVGYAAGAFVKTGKGTPSPYVLSGEDRAALLAAARTAIAERLAGKPAAGPELSERPVFNLQAAVFVTVNLPRPGGAKALRGCIGTTIPQDGLLDAVRRFALAAAFEDPRFQPLTAQELERAQLEISILSPTRPVKGPEEIVPGRDGVTVEKGDRAGLFLPQVWETLPSKDDFLGELCSQKAGLPRDCARDKEARLRVFSVESFEEK